MKHPRLVLTTALTFAFAGGVGAGSVVLHAAATSTVEDAAGTAGPQVGCLTVPF